MVVALFDAAFIGLALVVMGVPLALPLTVLTFFGAFIPIVGATLAGAAAALVALVDGGLGSALVILAAVVAVQQVEGHLLQPLVLGRAVAVHPVAIALSIAAGGVVAGLAGAVLAVPLAATVNTVGRYLAERRPAQRAALGQLAPPLPEPLPEPAPDAATGDARDAARDGAPDGAPPAATRYAEARDASAPAP
jgi:predicted PurR-regulated permease PerM